MSERRDAAARRRIGSSGAADRSEYIRRGGYALANHVEKLRLETIEGMLRSAPRSRHTLMRNCGAGIFESR
jgi:hypothetical protein